MVNSDKAYNQLFAKRIKKLRLDRDLTQDQFVNYLNSKGLKISRTSLARYEAQLSTIKHTNITNIAKIIPHI
ncbi:XRE family transcriptional regulator [Lactobacillus xujianguonis]|uniref:XRE family transcriptional regulator n=1 Tax=Lactobacillus xujianguonis TaxID=2495899 RepID=A0A437SW98_9LACO|nr:helix-turn-helix transcriptional regulator [Lactobacillus xujianguonis]RVU71196.1 XRE family transcriptional regulator [Lactobacillus xujianguonis]